MALTALAFAGPAGGGRAREDHQLACGDDRARLRGELHRHVHVEQLGNGTVTYVNSGTDKEIHSVYRVKLKAGTLKGTATTMATPGGMPTDPTTFLGAGQGLGRHPLLPRREGHVLAGRRHEPGRHADAQARRHAELPITT